MKIQFYVGLIIFIREMYSGLLGHRKNACIILEESGELWIMFAYLFQTMFYFWTESQTHYEAEFDPEHWSSGTSSWVLESQVCTSLLVTAC